MKLISWRADLSQRKTLSIHTTTDSSKTPEATIIDPWKEETKDTNSHIWKGPERKCTLLTIYHGEHENT